VVEAGEGRARREIVCYCCNLSQEIIVL